MYVLLKLQQRDCFIIIRIAIIGLNLDQQLQNKIPKITFQRNKILGILFYQLTRMLNMTKYVKQLVKKGCSINVYQDLINRASKIRCLLKLEQYEQIFKISGQKGRFIYVAQNLISSSYYEKSVL